MCVFTCACVWVKAGLFYALFWLVFHMGKLSGTGPIFPPKIPARRAPVRKSCQKPTPAAFPLCLFQEILITRLRLRSVPRPLFILIFLFIQRTGFFFVYLPPLLAHVIHFDASCLLICLSPEKENNSPLQCHLPLSLVSQCFHSVEIQELPQIMLCLNEPCCAFDCATVSIYNLPSEGVHT